MWQSIKKLLFKPEFLLLVFSVAAIIISIQLILLGTHPFTLPKPPYPNDIMNRPEYMNLFIGQTNVLTEYNNYMIFKYSFFHLVNGTNLYTIYPAQHWDFYKYSPTFALLMGVLAYLPNVIGLSIWNLLNGVALFFAIRMLPFNSKAQSILMWFVANELLTCFSNSQSNGLMCALIIAAYGCMQHSKFMWATLWLVLATYIKVYGAIGFCLFLFYPGKLKFVGYAVMWTIIFAALPLTVTPLHTLVWQYHNWADLMIADATSSTGLSVAGWLESWFGIQNSKTYVTVIGILLFLIPFVRINQYKNEVYRLLILASMLIWVIIFNHKAESPTYIIAVTGVGIWYYAMPKAKWRMAVLWMVLIFTCLGTTDLFPMYVKQHFIYPYKIKAFPCIVAWCVVLADLLLLKTAEIPAARVAETGDDLK